MKGYLLGSVVLLIGGYLVARFVTRPRDGYVSLAWLADQEARSLTVGVDLPRWRTPRERAEMARRERVMQMREARDTRARRMA